jgi:D-3-phosphoglycerate dehydrogenase / 2-oxoglutarate reductase
VPCSPEQIGLRGRNGFNRYIIAVWDGQGRASLGGDGNTARILICDQIDVELLALGSGLEVDYRPTISRDGLLGSVGDYDALIVRSRTKVDREILQKGRNLKLVARPGTGLDNIDVEFAKGRGIAVLNTPFALVEAVSEHVILLMLAMARNLVSADESTKAGRWKKNELVGLQLKGKVLGIVGLGRIGRRIAEIAGAFGMKILAYDVIPIPSEVLEPLGARITSLDELFSASDFITLHVPLTAETNHMVGESKLSMMKPGSYLINTSRGGVIDEVALAKALTNGVIGGAALDVFESEPPSGPILGAPNAILTPHIGGQTSEAQSDAVREIGEKVREFFLSSWVPQNVYLPTRDRTSNADVPTDL